MLITPIFQFWSCYLVSLSSWIHAFVTLDFFSWCLYISVSVILGLKILRNYCRMQRRLNKWCLENIKGISCGSAGSYDAEQFPFCSILKKFSWHCSNHSDTGNPQEMDHRALCFKDNPKLPFFEDRRGQNRGRWQRTAKICYWGAGFIHPLWIIESTEKNYNFFIFKQNTSWPEIYIYLYVYI